MKAPKYPILDKIEVPQKVIESWQVTANLLAEIAGITFRFPLESAPVRAGGMAAVPSHLFLGADGASPSTPSAETPVRPDDSHLLALVVDDDKASGVVAVKMLQNLGYRAEFAADGAKALKAFVPGKYSVILMDVAMPMMDRLVAANKTQAWTISSPTVQTGGYGCETCQRHHPGMMNRQPDFF